MESTVFFSYIFHWRMIWNELLITTFLIWSNFTKQITATGFYLQAVRRHKKLYHSAFYTAEKNVTFRVVFGKIELVEKQRFYPQSLRAR